MYDQQMAAGVQIPPAVARSAAVRENNSGRFHQMAPPNITIPPTISHNVASQESNAMPPPNVCISRVTSQESNVPLAATKASVVSDSGVAVQGSSASHVPQGSHIPVLPPTVQAQGGGLSGSSASHVLRPDMPMLSQAVSIQQADLSRFDSTTGSNENGDVKLGIKVEEESNAEKGFGMRTGEAEAIIETIDLTLSEGQVLTLKIRVCVIICFRGYRGFYVLLFSLFSGVALIAHLLATKFGVSKAMSFM